MKFRRLLALIMSTLMVASCVSFASAQDELPAEEIAEKSAALSEETENCKLILQVHDELIVSAPLSEADKAEEILIREMENAAKLSVPLVADANRGFSWYDAK